MYNKKIAKLADILYPYNCIAFPTNIQQSGAKQALIIFCANLKSLKLDKKYHRGHRSGHCSYLINMIPLYTYLIKSDYCNACHELLTLIHYEPLTQARVYYNLMYALTNYLGE